MSESRGDWGLQTQEGGSQPRLREEEEASRRSDHLSTDESELSGGGGWVEEGQGGENSTPSSTEAKEKGTFREPRVALSG